MVLRIFLFSLNPGSLPASTLEEVLEPYSVCAVETFLRSLYAGRLQHPDNPPLILELYSVSHTLEVGWLFHEITQFIKESVGSESVLDTLALALHYADGELQGACEGLLARTPLSEVVSPAESAWWEMPRELVVHVLRLPGLRVTTEVDVLVYVLYWVERNISVSNRDDCVELLESVRVFSLPNTFRETFLFPYIAIVSQKLFLALKYPQLNRWNVRLPGARTHSLLPAEQCTEFSISVMGCTGRSCFREQFYISGCTLILQIDITKLLPFSLTLDSEKNYDVCYAWFKCEETRGVFPLGERSILAASKSSSGSPQWTALDHAEIRRLFSSEYVRIGFMLYKN